MKVIVDLDGTLFLDTEYSKYLMKKSQDLYELSLFKMILNKELLKKLKGKEVFILTGRNEKYFDEATKEQLKDNGIKVSHIITCPKDRLVMEWKKDIVKHLINKFPKTEWIDNEARWGKGIPLPS